MELFLCHALVLDLTLFLQPALLLGWGLLALDLALCLALVVDLVFLHPALETGHAHCPVAPLPHSLTKMGGTSVSKSTRLQLA